MNLLVVYAECLLESSAGVNDEDIAQNTALPAIYLICLIVLMFRWTSHGIRKNLSLIRHQEDNEEAQALENHKSHPFDGC
jgi:hypothetical protein